MINGEHVLAVVPARGGSKGVPLKNLRPVLGVPLVARVGDCIREVSLIDRAVVSTDHDEIATVAEKAGIAAPFSRPPDLSGDMVGDLEVLAHALDEMERIDGREYGVIVMLQPTAPLRTPDQVTATIEKLISGNLDAVWTVSRADLKYHPLKQLRLNDGMLDFHSPEGAAIVARQQLEPVYFVNGVAYAFTRSCLVEQKTKMGKQTGAIVMDGPAVSIDTEEDFDLVEEILRSRG